jgi:hypothetical protein
MAVELSPKDQTTVIPLSVKDLRNMVGVVLPVNDAAIVLTPQTPSAQQVLVSAAGHYSLLVSNQNGPVKAGDYLSASSLPGIAMKAGSDQVQAVGRAAGNFNGNGSVGKVTLKTDQGRNTTVAIGHIPVDVQLAPNPAFQKNGSGVAGFVTKTANAIANRPVSPTRAYLSTGVVLATLFIVGIMFYAGTRSGITAVGRNPLAQAAITRSLLQTIIVGLVIFGLGIVAAYIILKP